MDAIVGHRYSKQKQSEDRVLRMSSSDMFKPPKEKLSQTSKSLDHQRTCHSKCVSQSHRHRRLSENFPAKPGFSPEAFELARNLILRKNSTVGVAILPPKRMRIENDFSYHRQEVRCKRSCHSVTTCSSQSNDHELKRLMPPPRPLAITNYPAQENNNQQFHVSAIPVFSIGDIIFEEQPRSNLQDRMTSSGGFPWDDWASSNYSMQKFREILLSGQNLLPITLIETEDHLFIKFTSIKHPNSENKFAEKDSLLKMMRGPIILPFRVVSGILKWIIGFD